VIYHATKLIEKAFNEQELKFKVEETENSSYVVAGFTVEKGPSLRALFISRDDDNDVTMRVYRVCSDVDADARPKMLEALNKLNSEYKYLKFVLDKDGDVNVEFEFLVRMSDDCLGACCAEVFIRTMKILDDAYPVLMKAMWS